jgi:hypothetical protein
MGLLHKTQPLSHRSDKSQVSERITRACRSGFTALGGRGGIRTHEARESLPLFESGSFNHSDTLPPRSIAHPLAPRKRR